jgi:nucleoside-diphosphate-sugar epimerase
MEINTNHKYKLLVVGGTGFIGRHIVKKALDLGFNTISLSKRNLNEKEKIKGVKYIVADITNNKNLINNLDGKVFDYVINCGGYINHSNYSKDGIKVFDTHFNGVKNLIDCLEKNQIKRFIQLGSSDEYGNNLAPQNENQKEEPFSMYSCAKVASNYFLQTLHKTENFPCVILRPFLVYGPYQGKDRFIPQIILGCIKDKKFSTSEGMQLRDFLFIDDFVDVVFMTLKNKNVLGEIINISSGIPVSIKKVINLIVDCLNSGQPQFGKIKYRDGENMQLYSDISKAKTLLNWEPKVDLETGILKTIESIKSEQLL